MSALAKAFFAVLTNKHFPTFLIIRRMVIRSNYARSLSHDGKYEMSLEEFKKWLQRFDADKDGRISKEELREAIRAGGVWFSRLRCRKGVKVADKNGNGFIDDNEITYLTDFALKHLGVRIVEY